MLLDEHHSPRAANRLQELGYDVVAAAGHPVFASLADEELLRAARADDRALVTEDTGDFLRIVRLWSQTQEDHAGLVLTPPRRLRRKHRDYPGNLVRALTAFLDDAPSEQRNEIWWLP